MAAARNMAAAVYTENDIARVDLTPVLNHLRGLCGHAEAAFEYVLKWHAQIVQHPEELTGVALILRSDLVTNDIHCNLAEMASP